MNIWATVTFGHTVLTQKWKLLEDEVCDDAEMRDFLHVMQTENGKNLVIQLDKQLKLRASTADGEVICYLGTLHIGEAKII